MEFTTDGTSTIYETYNIQIVIQPAQMICVIDNPTDQTGREDDVNVTCEGICRAVLLSTE
eukprot:UN20923